jgi:very-short-patch-repair endonuclease
MTSPLDRFAQQLCEHIAADLKSRFDFGHLVIESPIERIFWLCFHTAVDSHPVVGGLQVRPYADESSLAESADIYFGRQIRVLDWPVDFVIVARFVHDEFRSLARLAIECDGHEYHERTKEQAARDRSRDRSLQASGYTVMRFTGSELYRDPMKCVEEVLRWCQRNAWGANV